jgi:predicted transcriptional regulator
MGKTKPNFLEILSEVQKSGKPIKTYPSIATDYLGVARRGWKVISKVNELLEKHDCLCEPDFGSAWFYGEITISAKPKVGSGKTSEEAEDYDPTPRLSLLNAANLNDAKNTNLGKGLVSVTRDTLLSEAIHKMIYHDFSQLPILSSPRDVDGLISWKSIGRALALNKKCVRAADCKEDVIILNYDEPLFNAVKYILEKDVVLVRQKDRTISGIVTATDIGEQFISMAEPFLIIEQIENHLRKLLDRKFAVDEIASSIEHQAKPKPIKSLSDLTFGQYVRLLSDPDKFEKLKLNVDRALLVKQLDEVRKIRNDVMHFDPDGITVENLQLLRQTVGFFHTLSSTMRAGK